MTSCYVQQIPAHTVSLFCLLYCTKPRRCLISKLRSKENMHVHLGLCFFFFYTECLNLSTLQGMLSQGKSVHTFILISSQHKEAARTLKFPGHTLVPPFDSTTFAVIQLKKLKRYWASVVFSFQHPLFTLSVRRAPQIIDWMSCSRIFLEK